VKPILVRRIARAAAVLAMVAVFVPAPALAAPAPDSCAAERAVQFTADVPSELRTVGTHRIQYHLTWVNPDGSPGDGFTDNAITFQAGMPLYQGNVLIRLFRNWGRLPDGSLSTSVTTIDPTQAAVFYVFDSASPDDTVLPTTQVSVRYETRKNHWSDWIRLAASPIASACVANDGLTRMAFGWAG